MSDQNSPVIGFVGTGVMGQGMVKQLLAADYKVNVYNRTKSKTDDLIKNGAVWRDSISELTQSSDIVITIVGYPKDVESVYFDSDGILTNASNGQLLIDMTTSSPELAEKISRAGMEAGVDALDAPVSGGDVGAKKGTLSIMVGGSKTAYERALPMFKAMGENIVYQGPPGAGQHTKMANQITIASNMMGVCEALIYADKAGLNPETVLKSITTGAAGSWSLSNLAPRMIEGDFEPGFYVKHFIKDMAIALESAEKLGILTPGLGLSKQLYEELSELGEADSGTQALYKRYKEGVHQ